MDFPYDEPIASQYPDNVAEKFAAVFSRRSAYDGPGYCTVSYSRELTAINCVSDLDLCKPVATGVFLALMIHILISMFRVCFCRK